MDGRKVKTRDILERGTEMVRNPTTGAILDRRFYFMAGIENLEDGRIVDLAKLEPLRIAVVALN